MKINVMTMLEKRNNCIKALDSHKTCETCMYKDVVKTLLPCRDCYDEILGLPVDPTNWEEKTP